MMANNKKVLKVLKKRFKIICKVHNRIEAMQRKEIADIFFISPVYPSNSHPGQAPLKNYIFLCLCYLLKKKDIYALGGMKLKISNLKILIILGYGGISGLRSDMTEYNPKKLKKNGNKYGKRISRLNLNLIKKKKFYVLEMFPYPSGNIHMGHLRNYTIGDVIARFYKTNKYNVLHPMGWDSFGMPAENAAIENKTNPKLWTEENIKNMRAQLQSIGLSIDWDREISTCSKEYYKHQQKIFIDLYKKNLIYKKDSYVNWDPVDKLF